MNLLSPIGKNRFSFYIMIYIFVLLCIWFFLYSYGLSGYDLLDRGISSGTTLFAISFGLSILFFWILLFKRIKDFQKGKTLLILLYIFSFVFLFVPMLVQNYLGEQIYFSFLFLFNPIFPILLLLILSLKKGKIDENFNLINSKILGAVFQKLKTKQDVLSNKFLVGIYKYLFYLFLFGTFLVLMFIQDEGYLFKYEGYSEYDNTRLLKDDLYNKYNTRLGEVNYDNRDSYEEKRNIFQQAQERNDVVYSQINTELKDKRNGFNKVVYVVVALYFLVGFFIVKMLPSVLYVVLNVASKILYVVKVPFSVIYLYSKKSFSKLEEVEKKLKK